METLETKDWEGLFGERQDISLRAVPPEGAKRDDVNLATFTRADVAFVLNKAEGGGGSDPWLVYGKLKDGRWFVQRGKCGPSGWADSAENSGKVAKTLEDLIRDGLTVEERRRLGIEISVK